MMDGKRCSKCGEVKPLSEFTKDKGNRDGLDYWCRACKSKHAAAYYRSEAGQASYRRCNKRWAEKHPDDVINYLADYINSVDTFGDVRAATDFPRKGSVVL